MKHLIFSISVALLLLCTTTVKAQNTTTNTPPNKVNYSLGIGVGFTPQYEGSEDVIVLPSLVFAANWTSGQYIRFSGLGLEANILGKEKHKNWEFGPKLSFNLARNNDIVDNETVAAMENIDFALAAGLFTRYKFGKGFDIKAEFNQDISGVSDGGVGTLGIGYSCVSKRFITRFSAVSSFATKNYMDTYFGINRANVGTSGLADYSVDAGIKDIGMRINSTYIINKNWMLSGQLGYKTLLGDAANSPLVDLGSKNQLSGGLAAIYRF